MSIEFGKKISKMMDYSHAMLGILLEKIIQINNIPNLLNTPYIDDDFFKKDVNKFVLMIFFFHFLMQA